MGEENAKGGIREICEGLNKVCMTKRRYKDEKEIGREGKKRRYVR